ncbi:MAG: response regulator [Caulobacteraceae bacterium]
MGYLSKPQSNVLIVDEDEKSRRLLKQTLREGGFEAYEAATLDEMRISVARTCFQLIIMEIRYRREDGLSACKEICRAAAAVVIVVSKSTDVLDRILALEFGASDFLVKPVHARELMARIKIACSRSLSEQNNSPSRERWQNIMVFGKYEFSGDRQKLRMPDGTERDLTLGECNLLAAFLSNAGRIITREELAKLGFGDADSTLSRAIDASIKRLRRKLRQDGENDVIRTVKGVGYIIDKNITLR